MSGPSPVVPTLALVTITQMELTRLKQGHNFWQAQHQRAVEREAVLKKEMAQNEAQACHQETLLKKKIEQLEAQVRDLRHRPLAKKAKQAALPPKNNPSRSRSRNALGGNNRAAAVMVGLSARIFRSSKSSLSFMTCAVTAVVCTTTP